MASPEAEGPPPPAWLDQENDETIFRQEIAPLLFGTGKLTLEDPEDDHEEGQCDDEGSDDDETAAETTATTSSLPKSVDNKKGYGATSTSNSKNRKFHWSSIKSAVKIRDTPSLSVPVDVSTGEPQMPRRSWCLEVFIFINVCAVCTCLCVLVSQAIPVFLVPINEFEPVELVLSIYISIFALLFMVVEWDPPIPFVRNASFLQAYSSRGFLYSFLGATCLQQAYNERVNDMELHANDQFHIAWFTLLIQISAWALCVVGVLYFVLGLFCLKRLRDKLVLHDQAKRKTYQEAKAAFRKENPV